GPKTSIICSPMTSLKTSIKTITYLSDIGCLEIQGASLNNDNFAPGKTAADYSFSSSASWVGVDATGKVTFKNDGDSNTVIITAPPRSGGAIYQTVPPESRSV
ncbi:hypothetical protein OYA84_23155, partial [Escherichia coli]